MNPSTRIQPHTTARCAGRSRMQAAIIRIQNQNIAIVPTSVMSAMRGGVGGGSSRFGCIRSKFACSQKYSAVVTAVKTARKCTKYHCPRVRDGAVMRSEQLRVPGQVLRDEALDEEIAVIITVAHLQVDLLPGRLAGGH